MGETETGRSLGLTGLLQQIGDPKSMKSIVPKNNNSNLFWPIHARAHIHTHEHTYTFFHLNMCSYTNTHTKFKE